MTQEHVRVADLGPLIPPVIDDRQRALIRKRQVEPPTGLVLDQRQPPVRPVDLIEPQPLDVPRPPRSMPVLPRTVASARPRPANDAKYTSNSTVKTSDTAILPRPARSANRPVSTMSNRQPTARR
jgi:hypothetical protein